MMSILDVRNSVVFAIAIVVVLVTLSTMPLHQLEAASGCREPALDPASPTTLQRPHALRYRGAPTRVCAPD